MKKFIICISIFTVILSMFVACGDKGEETESTTSAPTTHSISYINDNYSTTKPSYTAGAVKTSERFGDDDKAYVIAYYDENNFLAKEEVYENGKMAYYYISTGNDDMGNSTQVKYYTPDGKFVATHDNGFFFDEKGNKISETSFEALLGMK